MDRPFENVIKTGLSDIKLSKNQAMSCSDMGFLYSMLSMAYKKKKDIGFIKWSSKL